MDFDKFIEFLQIMEKIPKINDIDELCKNNNNLIYLNYLSSLGYFKLLCPIQKYHLFSTACAHNSIDIAILLYKNNIDFYALKEFMLNYLAVNSSDSDYVIFRWIWEKKQIIFSNEDNIDFLIKILKAGNLEFIEWFCSLNIINYSNINIKNKIINEVLNFANSQKDYLVAKFISKKYLYYKNLNI